MARFTLDSTIRIETGGTLQKSNGTLILTGTTTSNGLIDVVSGQLQGDADSLDGTIELDSAGSGLVAKSELIFDQTGTGTFDGSISGAGAVFP